MKTKKNKENGNDNKPNKKIKWKQQRIRNIKKNEDIKKIAKKINNGWLYFQHITCKKSLDLIKEAKS